MKTAWIAIIVLVVELIEGQGSDLFCSLRSQLRGPVAPYTPVFFDGWKPEALKPDGQVWEDPVESQHKLEALREKQEVWDPSITWFRSH